MSGTSLPSTTIVVTFPNQQNIQVYTKDGDHIFVTEIDSFGNRSQPRIGQVVDTTAPKTPPVDQLSEGITAFRGIAEPKSKDVVTMNAQHTLEAQVNQDSNRKMIDPVIGIIQAHDKVSVKVIDESAIISLVVFVNIEPVPKTSMPTEQPIANETLESVNASEVSRSSENVEKPEAEEVIAAPKIDGRVAPTEKAKAIGCSQY